eukprot:gene5328-5998_t
MPGPVKHGPVDYFVTMKIGKGRQNRQFGMEQTIATGFNDLYPSIMEEYAVGHRLNGSGDLINGKDYFHEYLCHLMTTLMHAKKIDAFGKQTQTQAGSIGQERRSILRPTHHSSFACIGGEDRQRRNELSFSLSTSHLLHPRTAFTNVSQDTSRQHKVVPAQQPSADCADVNYLANIAVVPGAKAEKGPYVCNDCGKVLKRSSSLSNHRLIHKNVKAFKCEKCGVSFLRKSDLGKHYAVHTGTKPYVCDVCNKSFSQSSNMLTHRRRHSGVKPFKCEYCLKSFYRKVDVKRHEVVHTINEDEV